MANDNKIYILNYFGKESNHDADIILVTSDADKLRDTIADLITAGNLNYRGNTGEPTAELWRADWMTHPIAVMSLGLTNGYIQTFVDGVVGVL